MVRCHPLVFTASILLGYHLLQWLNIVCIVVALLPRVVLLLVELVLDILDRGVRDLTLRDSTSIA